MNEREQMKVAQDHCDKNEFDAAIQIVYRWLKANPNDARWLTLMAYILLATEKVALAYQVAKRVVAEAPKYSAGWLNYGRAAADLWLDKESIRAYKRALRCAQDDKQRAMVCVNLSSVLVDNGRFDEGRVYAEKALELNPDSIKGRANLGFSQLANREWVPGWANYRYCVGSEWRPRVQFNNEPDWDGISTGTIAVWGEQGLGDEISFASMLPDMQRWCKENDSHLIVECDPRLGALFKRSFPDIEIQPTRGQKKVTWDTTRIDYSIPVAQLGEYFRTKTSDFPGKPYLIADQDRVLQWKALFQSKQKPVIGLAWRSGIPKTGSKYRQLDLESLVPILQSVDAHWVSLQYKPAGEEIREFKANHPDIDLVEYSHGTLSNDYDDTVAMIAAMDHVVCMHTTCNHVAGGLGIPAWVMVPQSGQWRYGSSGTDFPWAKSVKLYRQEKRGEWDEVINRLAGDLNAYYPRVPKATAKHARQQDKVRGRRGKVRGNGRADHRQHGAEFAP